VTLGKNDKNNRNRGCIIDTILDIVLGIIVIVIETSSKRQSRQID